MIKTLKYKLINYVEDNKFIVILLSYFIIFNYEIIVASGVLSIGSGTYNLSIKRALILNNYSIVAITFGLILAIYLGAKIIGKDIETRQMYMLMTNVHSRIVYILLSWVSVVLYLLIIQSLFTINVLIISKCFDVELLFSELMLVNRDILFNMIVISTITSLFSVIFEGYMGCVAGLISLVLFNIHTYATIPLANVELLLSDNFRRLLVNIAPIKNIKIMSSIDSGYSINFLAPSPYIIESITVYQVIFTLIILGLTVFAFKKKDL